MNLFLSRLMLDPRSRQVRSELRDPNELHRTLSKAFAFTDTDQEAGRSLLKDARMLFRVDAERTDHVPIIVQSRTHPDWSALTSDTDYLHRNPETVEFAPSFFAGQTLAFRLRANPTVKRNGKRYGLYSEELHTGWLRRKSTEGGFAVLQATALVENRELAVGRGQAHSAEFVAVRFDGMLRVQDPARFAEQLASGIGSGKAFGFGLLSLSRLA